MLAKVAVHILNAVQELGFRLALYAEAGQAVHTEQLVVYRGLESCSGLLDAHGDVESRCRSSGSQPGCVFVAGEQSLCTLL